MHPISRPLVEHLKNRTLKSCIGVGSGNVLLEGNKAFGSGERVWFAGGLVSFSLESNESRSDCAYQAPLQNAPQRP